MAETKKQEIAVVDGNKKAVGYLLGQVVSYAEKEGTTLSGREQEAALNIISDIDKALRERGVSWNDVDFNGYKLESQVKRYARLGLSTAESEVFVDVRYNSKTAKQDVFIKKQYQGVEKEIIKYCSKKIDHFKRGVICVGDEIEIEEDFETGYDKLIKHIKNNDPKLDRNLLDNITGAYTIAYEKTANGFIQHIALIDRNRIMRAYNSSASREKTVWKNDTQRMVLKTASWVLYNNVLKPYINIPTELAKDWQETNDKMEFESLNAESQEQQDIIYQNVGEGDIVAFDDEAEATN